MNNQKQLGVIHRKRKKQGLFSKNFPFKYDQNKYLSSLYKRVVLPIHWVDSPIYWVLIYLLVRVWSYEVWSLIDLLVEINVIMQQTPKLQLPSTTSKSILSQDYNRSKDPFNHGSNSDVEKNIQNCQISYTRSFVNFKLYLIKVVYVLANFHSDVDVILLFINESGIIQKKNGYVGFKF